MLVNVLRPNLRGWSVEETVASWQPSLGVHDYALLMDTVSLLHRLSGNRDSRPTDGSELPPSVIINDIRRKHGVQYLGTKYKMRASMPCALLRDCFTRARNMT